MSRVVDSLGNWPQSLAAAEMMMHHGEDPQPHHHQHEVHEDHE